MNDTSLRVLLIDDDVDLAEMYRLKLELDGWSVALVHDGKKGLEKAVELVPDAILLDVQLPTLGGLAVLDALRAQPSTAMIPVVLFSNRDDLETIDAAFGLRATDYLVKYRTPPALLSERLWRVVREGHGLKSRLPLLPTARPALRR